MNRLKQGNCDKWGAGGDLAFLIHSVGDIHQPLHAATDADKGGNCIAVESHPRMRNLHAAWDTVVVYRLEDNVDSGGPDPTAHKLEQLYVRQKDADCEKQAEPTTSHGNRISWLVLRFTGRSGFRSNPASRASIVARIHPERRWS